MLPSAVAQTPSTTSLKVSPNASNYGQTVTLTATVSAGTTGKVTFYDGVGVLGIATVSGNQATLSTPFLPSGPLLLRAYYNGDTSFSGSSSSVVPHTVTAGVSLGFQAALKQTYGTIGYNLATGDFNGDGMADVVVASAASGLFSAKAYLGNGDGTFRLAGTTALGNLIDLAVSDFNGDGRDDVAYADNNGAVTILLTNADGSFATPVSYNLGGRPWKLVTADFNGDGHVDLAVANRGTSNLHVLIGNGDGTFAAPVNYTLSFGPTLLAAGDFNGDGKTDLVAGVATSIAILSGNGDGTFGAPVLQAVSSLDSLTVNDFNGDGIADIVGGNSGQGVAVLLGDGKGSFGAPILQPNHDLNRDNAVDVADLQKVVEAILGVGCIY